MPAILRSREEVSGLLRFPIQHTLLITFQSSSQSILLEVMINQTLTFTRAQRFGLADKGLRNGAWSAVLPWLCISGRISTSQGLSSVFNMHVKRTLRGSNISADGRYKSTYSTGTKSGLALLKT
jgi:hypothetical protein